VWCIRRHLRAAADHVITRRCSWIRAARDGGHRAGPPRPWRVVDRRSPVRVPAHQHPSASKVGTASVDRIDRAIHSNVVRGVPQVHNPSLIGAGALAELSITTGALRHSGPRREFECGLRDSCQRPQSTSRAHRSGDGCPATTGHRRPQTTFAAFVGQIVPIGDLRCSAPRLRGLQSSMVRLETIVFSAFAAGRLRCRGI
jgi:hypothetical protein